MSLPRNFSDQAIILKRSNYSEADRIITIFSLRYGKIAALAKGVRKTTSRKAPHVELFSHTKLYFVRTKGLPIITQAETIDSFSHLKTNLDSTRLAFHVAEVVDRLFVDDQHQPQIFHQLTQLFTLLDTDNRLTAELQQKSVTNFHLNLLSTLGFGLPVNQNASSVNTFIETIIDRRLLAQDNLS